MIILKLDYFETRSFLDIFFFQVLSLEEILAEGVPAQVTADHSDEDCQNDHCNHQLAQYKSVRSMAIPIFFGFNLYHDYF